MEDEYYQPERVDELLKTQFGEDWAAQEHIDPSGNVPGALAAVLQYMQRTRNGAWSGSKPSTAMPRPSICSCLPSPA